MKKMEEKITMIMKEIEEKITMLMKEMEEKTHTRAGRFRTQIGGTESLHDINRKNIHLFNERKGGGGPEWRWSHMDKKKVSTTLLQYSPVSDPLFIV